MAAVAFTPGVALHWISPRWTDARTGMPLAKSATGVCYLEADGQPIETSRQQVRMAGTGLVAVEYTANQTAAFAPEVQRARRVELVVRLDGQAPQRQLVSVARA